MRSLIKYSDRLSKARHKEQNHPSPQCYMGTHLTLDLLIPVIATTIRKVADNLAQPQLAYEKIGALAVGHLCSHTSIHTCNDRLQSVAAAIIPNAMFAQHVAHNNYEHKI